MTDKSKWIWVDANQSEDTYGEFYTEFEYSGGIIKLDISADSNYAVFLNGKFVDSGQYPDYPHYKIYDSLNISKYCTPGTNKLAVIVWYYGDRTIMN